LISFQQAASKRPKTSLGELLTRSALKAVLDVLSGVVVEEGAKPDMARHLLPLPA
jgi:hypothetical protein